MRQLLRDGAIVDVRTGRAIVDGAILVAGERIEAVGRSADFGEQPDGATVVELGGAFVVPGFVDPHVHVAFTSEPDALERVSANAWHLAARNTWILLESGVTTAADCGGPGELTLRLKQAIDHGDVAGPRLLVSLNPITTRSGHCNLFWGAGRRCGLRSNGRAGADCPRRGLYQGDGQRRWHARDDTRHGAAIQPGLA